MTSIVMAFGSTVCGVLRFAGNPTPGCHNPAELTMLGATFMTFLAILTLGWGVARRV